MNTSNVVNPVKDERQYFYTDPKIRILIMSAPRTGSTLLVDYLNQANIGSDTQEFIHQDFCQKYAITSRSALSYIRKVALRHTSGNGIFLCKTSYNSFVWVFENAPREGEAWLNYFTHFILIRRRDHLAQAISEFFATKTGKWNVQNSEPNFELNSMTYNKSDLELMTRILSRQISEDDSWLETIETMKLRAAEIYYEDLVASPITTIEKVFRTLDLPHPDRFEPETRYVPISDREAVEKFKLDYLNHLQGR